MRLGSFLRNHQVCTYDQTRKNYCEVDKDQNGYLMHRIRISIPEAKIKKPL